MEELENGRRMKCEKKREREEGRKKIKGKNWRNQGGEKRIQDGKGRRKRYKGRREREKK